MRPLLCALVILASAARAESTLLTTSGLQKTALDFVWKLLLKENGWSGQLDCQSFIHNLKLTSTKYDVVKYLDPNECEEWHDRLEDASPARPVCLSVDEIFSVRQVQCPPPVKILPSVR